MGATLYHMLTLRYPRDFGGGQDPLNVILSEPVLPIRRRDPQVAEDAAYYSTGEAWNADEPGR